MTNQLKQTLRFQYGQIRKNLSLTEQHTASQSVCTQIQSLIQYQHAISIALYHAVNGEINLNYLWQSAISQHKQCYYPKIEDDNTLSFLPATDDTPWSKNRLGILEPDVTNKPAISPEQLDIMIIPLVAFDNHGTRLGMGGGYYDRTLAKQRPGLLIGVAYEFQRLRFIQPDTWDIPMTLVITPQTIYWSKS